MERPISQPEKARLDLAICKRLGIDPNSTTSVTVELEAGTTSPVVRWTGARKVPWELLADLFEMPADPS